MLVRPDVMAFLESQSVLRVRGRWSPGTLNTLKYKYYDCLIQTYSSKLQRRLLARIV